MKRSVGYCTNSECEDFSKGVFLLNHGNSFYCPRCRCLGFTAPEYKVYSDDAPDAVFKTVRVHFNYNPMKKVYQSIAVIDITEVTEGEQCDLYSPLIRTEMRALKVGEALICMINSGLRYGDSQEVSVSLDDDDWREQLNRINRMLEDRDRRFENALG